jgi:hypothetical protein
MVYKKSGMRLRSKLAGCADLREVREAFSSRTGSRDEIHSGTSHFSL